MIFDIHGLTENTLWGNSFCWPVLTREIKGTGLTILAKLLIWNPEKNKKIYIYSPF